MVNLLKIGLKAFDIALTIQKAHKFAKSYIALNLQILSGLCEGLVYGTGTVNHHPLIQTIPSMRSLSNIVKPDVFVLA